MALHPFRTLTCHCVISRCRDNRAAGVRPVHRGRGGVLVCPVPTVELDPAASRRVWIELRRMSTPCLGGFAIVFGLSAPCMSTSRLPPWLSASNPPKRYISAIRPSHGEQRREVGSSHKAV